MKVSNLLALSPILITIPGFLLYNRTFYIFELFVFIVLLCLLFDSSRIHSNKSAFLLFMLMNLYSAFVFVLQISLGFTSPSLSFLRISLLFAPVILYPSLVSSSYTKFFSAYEAFVVFASSLAVFQFVDSYLLSGSLSIQHVIAFLYPYQGYLDSNALELSKGAQVAVNSYGSATSIADGHSILLGDLLAICALPLLWEKRWPSYFLTVLATLVTFSRASWLMLLIGSFLITRISFKRLPMIILFSIALIAVILSYPPLRDAFAFRILNSLYVFGFSDQAVGYSVDPRTAQVWPDFFASFKSTDLLGFLIGIDYQGPVDSGFFSVFNSFGLIGLLLFLSLVLYPLFLYPKDPLIFSMSLAFVVGMVFHPLDQGLRLMFAFFVFLAFRLSFLDASQRTMNKAT